MKRIWSMVGAVGLIVVGVAQAQEGRAFKSSLSAGVMLTDGNSETLQANVGLVTEGEKEGLGSVRVGFEANYGESTVDGEKETTVNNARAFAGARKTISPRTFGALEGAILQDDIADIDYRAMLGLGLGTYLVRNETTSLSVEAGPAYIWEDVGGISDDYFAFRFAEQLDYALSETARIWQSLEYLPRYDDFGDYLLTAELGVETAMTTRVNLRLVLRNKYDSTPGEGLKKNDLTLIAGIGVSL